MVTIPSNNRQDVCRLNDSRQDVCRLNDSRQDACRLNDGRQDACRLNDGRRNGMPPTNKCLRSVYKNSYDKDEHSSLFCSAVIDEGKKFYDIDTICFHPTQKLISIGLYSICTKCFKFAKTSREEGGGFK
jgi:hypothetical protein